MVTFSAADYAEDTDFERFVLERLGTHRIRLEEPSAIHDMRGRVGGVGGSLTIKVGSATMGSARVEELARSLRPLGFGAAYKTLDLLVEQILRANTASRGRLSFVKKSAALRQRPTRLPVPLDARPDLWDRLAKVYVQLQEARHAVTHRRAQATQSGDLEIHNDVGKVIDTVTSGEISAFAACVHGTAELVIEGSSDDRRLEVVGWHLNGLQARHGLSPVPATDPNAYRRLLVMDLLNLDDGQVRFDVAQAKEAIEGQQASLWDLRLHAEERVFVGHWEDVTNHERPIDFNPAALPKWLSEQIPDMSV